MGEQGGRRRRRKPFESDGSSGEPSPEFRAALKSLKERDAARLEEAPEEEPPDSEQSTQGTYTWRQWAAQNRAVVVLACVVVALAIYGALSVATGVFSGGAGAKSSESAPGEGSPGAQSGAGANGQAGKAGGAGATSLAAQRVGSLKVTRDEKQVEVLFEKPSGKKMEWSGKLSPGEETPRLELSGPTAASFVSVLSESGRRSWLGFIKQTKAGGGDYAVEATLSSDPGQAAISGSTPVVRGSYVVKARDGSFSASGAFTDVLVSERKVERTYKEEYRSAAGGSAARERTIKVAYDLDGEPAIAPALFGWSPPADQGPRKQRESGSG